jgi:hypothetical protein
MLHAFLLAQAIAPVTPTLLAAPLRDYGSGEKPAPKEDEPVEVRVRAKPPPRSASDWRVDPDAIASVPHQTGADVLGTLPGVYVSNRGLLGQAPYLAVRGFEGTSGQNLEIFAGNVPLNQVSNIRAPGYADMRLVMPEVIRSVSISHGPYDPRQGDFAVAGSVRLDLGLEKRGFLGKATVGSFGSRRALLAFSPPVDDRHWQESFAAIDTYATDGPGSGRGGQRTSFVGQLAYAERDMSWRLFVLVGSARFDFPGLLARRDVESGQAPYAAMDPLGRDQTAQTHVGNEFEWEIEKGVLTLGAFLSSTKMQIHEDLTGYALDVLAGLPPVRSDDAEQVNRATTYGLNVAYVHPLSLVSELDRVEVGAFARIDSIDQTDTRLWPGGTIDVRNVDAAIDSTNIAGYVDAALHPFPRVVVRGGTRVDSVSYSVTDHLHDAGLDRTAQGVHAGNKVVVDYAAGGGLHLVAGYGEGFRSPQARDLAEGAQVPFATIESVEAGVRLKKDPDLQASLVAFGSWLNEDLVFDPLQRIEAPAPSSSRAGLAGAVGLRRGAFGTSASATYVRAVFTGSDGRFHEGAAVPYAPALVLRDDVYVVTKLGSYSKSSVVGRFGAGVQGAAGARLPDGSEARPAMYVDALASATWRSIELGLNAMNLFDQRYYDLQYFYRANFARSPTLPPPSARVIVADPASVFLTLKVLLDIGARADRRYDD